MTFLRRRLTAIVLGLCMIAVVAGCSTAQPAAAPTSDTTSATRIDATADTVVSPPLAAASVPVRVEIPAIAVDSDLMGLGLQDDGTMEVPAGGFPGGWYTGSPTPGQLGPSILAGHVDWDGAPGVFFRLDELSSGDDIIVTRADASVVTFEVSSVEQYRKAEFPTASVYGDIDHAGLRLITCGGEFDSAATSYDDNIVVYADMVDLAA